MAEKKKIKNIKENPGDGASIICNGIDPKTGAVTGADEMFDQPNYKAMCFNVDDVINTDSILVGGVSTIVLARRISRGTILSLGTDGVSGTISENKTGKAINFYQPNIKELGLMAGTEVNYDLIADLIKGGEIAVNVAILV
ncbi:MAG TPA: hypothetical protein VFJ43_08695 [Bacteroidia bacterium]|nr:hypothetical protein [Bacteroidia bacterium]